MYLELFIVLYLILSFFLVLNINLSNVIRFIPLKGIQGKSVTFNMQFYLSSASIFI